MERTNLSAINASQTALTKLLIKLTLLPPGTEHPSSPDDDLFPIAYFASKGLCNEERAVRAVGEHLGIPIYQADEGSIQRLILCLEDPRLATIDLPRWRACRAIPVEFSGNHLQIALANPLIHEARTAIEFELGCPVSISIAPESFILRVLAKQISSSKDLFDLAESEGEAEGSKTRALPSSAAFESSLLTDELDSAPVIRLVNKIFADSVQRQASDIHIESRHDGIGIRVRIDGILHSLFSVPRKWENQVISRIKLLAGMDISERRKPQDGRFRIKTTLGNRDLRVSAVPSVHGETIVIRILSTDLTHFDLAKLGMSQRLELSFRRVLSESSRVVLVTGPTGSGKTTTLYTAVLSLCDGHHNIITIEDPIEYRMAGVTQIQVNTKTGLTFAEGLRSILRQDPDVVMVGEIRDHETAAVAMQVAQTGHLVLSTFHTNDAPAALTRLRDLEIPTYSIASSVGAIIAQRLVRCLCPHCAQPATPQEVAAVQRFGVATTNLRRAVGCDRCNNLGFSGRTAIYSLLEISDEIRDAIRSGKGESDIIALARATGFLTLHEAALEAIAAGATTLDEVERILGPFEEPRVSAASAVPSSASPTIAKRKILLVEDDENTREILGMLLEGAFYEVVKAEDGQQGLEKIYTERPELIVCDLMMPKMSGIQLLQRIRGDARTRHIPVLMLTAVGTEENECSLISGGADDFVAKGSDTRILLARIQRLMERSQQL